MMVVNSRASETTAFWKREKFLKCPQHILDVGFSHPLQIEAEAAGNHAEKLNFIFSERVQAELEVLWRIGSLQRWRNVWADGQLSPGLDRPSVCLNIARSFDNFLFTKLRQYSYDPKQHRWM